MAIVPQIEAASISMGDSLVIMVIALVVFGPRRLPQIGRQIGKLMYEFRKASNDFKYQMEEEMRNAEEADRRKKEEERLAAMAAVPAVKEEKPEPDVTHVLTAGEEAPPEYVAAHDPYPYGGDVPPSETQAVEQIEGAAGESSAINPETSQPETSQAGSQVTTPRIQPPATGAPIAYKPVTEPATGEAAGAEAEIPTPGAGTEQTAHHD